MTREVDEACVDKEWYLNTYPDVANAGMDPIYHYVNHGKSEGRMPCFLPSLPVESKLWGDAFNPDDALNTLEKYSEEDDLNGLYASKVLVEFYLFQAKYDLSEKFAVRILKNVDLISTFVNQNLIFMLCFEAAYFNRNFNIAKELVFDSRWLDCNSKWLAKHMLSKNRRDFYEINKIFKRNRLSLITSENNTTLFDSVIAVEKRVSFGKLLRKIFFQELPQEKVSVIVPIFNAGTCLHTAIRSLLNQSYQNLEIILVDDCSTDNSYDIALSYAEISSIKVCQNTENLGAYKTRNIGIRCATGKYITVMDADDWAHPQKLEKQVRPMQKKSALKATVSHWVRCNEGLEFTRLKSDGSWVYRNISSLLIERSVIEEIGFWDELKANADSEFYLRLQAKYGKNCILEVYPDVPLSFGRAHENSITQHSSSHLVTIFGGCRKEHLDYAKAWHKNTDTIRFDNTIPPFPVPHEICHHSSLQRCNPSELSRWRAAFNNQWYLNENKNLNNLGVGLHDHFWEYGEKEDLAPSPLFVPSAYALEQSLDSNVSATWQALVDGREFTLPVSLTGSANNTGVRIALFGHSATSKLFGSELSLLDMAEACCNIGIRIELFLPSAQNRNYVESFLHLVENINFLPTRWFTKGKHENAEQIDFLANFFTKKRIEIVYLNTIMLFEPYIAARKSDIPIVTHVRELPNFDHDICKALGLTPTEIRERLLETSDYFIANSRLTADWISSENRCSIVYNRVKQPLDNTLIDYDKPLKVCMLSSNIRKKGIYDFFEIASHFKSDNIIFNLYGPKTDELKQASTQYKTVRVNVCGYYENPYEAILQNDIVLCLSHFKESFGRTAAEAMINSRLVIAYDWGAMNEFIDESTGILVPLKRIDLVVEKLSEFSKNKQRLGPYVKQAKERADALFSASAYERALKAALANL